MGRVPAPQPSGIYQRQKYPSTGSNYDRFGEQAQNGWIYIPYEDKYVPDPKKQQEYAYQSGLAERPKEPPGLFESLAPVAGVGAALYGGKYLGEKGIPGLFGGGGSEVASQVANTGSNIAGSFAGGAAAPGAAAAPGSAAGAIAEAPATGMFDLGGIGSGGNVILPAVGAYGAYDMFTNDYGTGRNALQGAASGAAIGSYFNAATGGLPVGTLAGAGIGAGVGLIKGLFGDHETTKESQSKNWSELAKSSDPATAAYAKQYLDVIAQGDGSGRTYQAIKSDPNATGRDVWGAKAFFDAVPGWLSEYSEDQREQIAKRAMDADLLKGHKGDILGTDSGAIKKIADEIRGATAPKPSSQSKRK